MLITASTAMRARRDLFIMVFLLDRKGTDKSTEDFDLQPQSISSSFGLLAVVSATSAGLTSTAMWAAPGNIS
jgi:hypothetical protein